MERAEIELSLGVTRRRGAPYVEFRARSVGGAGGPIPKGKVLVIRTPILPPGASDREVESGTERELCDDGV